jgi:indole-3-glycerol phosphate synthase
MLLDEIILHKQKEVAVLKEALTPQEIKKIRKSNYKLRDFAGALKKGSFSLIAEIKKASPSAGVLIDNFDPVKLAKIYEQGGAAALSVLTDEKYFQGKIENLAQVKPAVELPLLRKDFIIDESQLYQSLLAGADAVLLIARILSDEKLSSLLALAGEKGLGCLVEVHDEKELERAMSLGAELIGINNRDLDTLAVDFTNTLRLLEKFPAVKQKIVVSESGINSPEQVKSLKAAGVAAVLVGEGLLKSHDIPAKIKELMGR